MKIQICSDLHLELTTNRRWMAEHPIVPKAKLLIIAGDTYHLDKDYTKLDFIKQVSDEFEMTYLVPGNHEYYGGFDVATAADPTYFKIRENVIMLNNQAVRVGDLKLIFSTMWSAINNNSMQILRYMPDFHQIRYAGVKMSIDQYNHIHRKCFDFLEKEVKTPEKKVVVTHHLPSDECTIEAFKGSLLGEAFCVEKSDFISQSNITAWVYGHSHRNLKDFEINTTRMVTNQLGYVHREEHRTFCPDKVIEFA